MEDQGSMWLQNSLHVPSDPLNQSTSSTSSSQQQNNNGNDDSGFAAPAPFSARFGGSSRGNRLPSLALCHDLGDSSSSSSSQQQPLPRASAARASVAGAHSQQLFAIQEQLTLSKASVDDLKNEVGQLQQRLELEQKATKRWQDRAEQEAEGRTAAERKLQDSRLSDSGEMGALREELSNLDQALREERRKSSAAKAEAIRQLTEQFEQERVSQEKWWKESATETSQRIASLEQQVASTNNVKRELEVAQRNESDLRGHFESLRTELENAQNVFDMELRQQASSLRDEHNRALLKQEDDFIMRMNQVQKEEGAKIGALRTKVVELEEVAHSTESLRRDLEATRDVLKEREADLAQVRREAAAARARLESENSAAIERLEEEHQSQMETLVAEHTEELGKMRSRVAAASTLNERCARVEKLAQEHQQNSQKHEAELQAVLGQLGDLQRANLRLEQERDDFQRRATAAERAARAQEDEVQSRIEQARMEREQQNKSLQQALDQAAEEHKDVEAEWEANLEAMLARISTMETNFAQQESAWQKERFQLRSQESDARRAALDASENVASMQSTISMLSQKLDEANAVLESERRDRSNIAHQLADFKSHMSEQQRQQAKADVDLAAARSTVRALETRLEVVRAGSVAQPSPSVSSAFWNSSALTSSSSSSSQMLPTLSSFTTNAMNNKLTMLPPVVPVAPAGQVTEIEDSDENSNHNTNTKSNDVENIVPRPTSAAGGFRSHIVSRSSSQENSAGGGNNNSNSGRVALRRTRENSGASDSAATRVVDDGRLRVFAFTGFDPSEVQRLQKEVDLLGGKVVECKANSVPPHECTHLVSNGLMTVKLLASLARGAWVVPSSFIHQCTASRGFVSEEANGGIRHRGPFFGQTAVAMSPAFRATRHAATAETVVSEGSATLVERDDLDLKSYLEASAWPKLSKQVRNRMLICTPQESSEIESQVGRMNMDIVTWDSLLKRLYPEPLSA